MFFWISITALISIPALYWFRRQVLEPMSRLRQAIRGLATGSFRSTLLVEGIPPLRGAARDLDAVAAKMEEMQRLLSDEAFSLRAILGSMIEGVLIVDEHQRIRVANQALLSMFNLPSAPIDRTVLETFRDHALQQAIAGSLQTGEPGMDLLVLETQIEGRPAHRQFEVNVSAMRQSPSEAPMGAIAVFHDITEIKALESIRQDLVANVSHELRTPLSIIHGYVETLLDGALDDRALSERFLRVMHKHGERITLLLDDLLTLSRLESGTAKLNFEKTDLRDVLNTVLERLESSIAERGATIRIEFSTFTPEIAVDQHRIDQVFFNLLDNALKYASESGPAITIRAEKTSEEIRISITDNGPGIPLEDQPHLFERFYRVHKDRNRDAGGTGLGLSIVKHVMQAHGGNVTLVSSPGKGSTFCITLPLRQTE